MTARCFGDTNLFVYAASNAPADQAKRKIARALIEAEDIGISTQVLQEFIAAALAKKRLAIGHPEIEEMLRGLSDFATAPLTFEVVAHGWEIHKRYGLSCWDSAIIASARTLECEIIFTEDMNDGQIYKGIKVVNPFKAA